MTHHHTTPSTWELIATELFPRTKALWASKDCRIATVQFLMFIVGCFALLSMLGAS